MKPINSLILLFCLVSAKGLAQPTHTASLPKVNVDAYYAINLPYEVLGGVSPDFADIRIVDSNGKEVAWLLREDGESIRNKEFIPFPMKISSVPNRTDILITNEGEPLSSFVLKIKNIDVNKEATLLGSNNGVQWFGVKDRFRMNKSSSLNQAEAFLRLDFPLSDYKFYKLSLNDSLSAPLNIIGVGQVKEESLYRQHLLEVPLTRSHVATKKKESVMQLVFPFKYQIERLDFYLSAPRYYNRSMELLQPYEGRFTTTLSNKNGYPQSIAMGVFCDTLRLSIQNGDDQPLTIDSIKAYVRKYSLIAELKTGVNYTLTYGDKQASFPQYDLSFGKQLPDSIVRLTVGDIELCPTTVAQQEESAWWLSYLKTYGIWLIIVLVIIQILYMVRKMMKKETNLDD